MIEKQSLAAQHILDCLNTNYDIKVATLTFIPLGADIDASVYKAQTYDQSSYFVKLKPGHHDIGTIIQRLLKDAGILQIIVPVKTNDGQTTRPIEDFTLMVYPFIEVQDGFSRDLSSDQWVTLGKALRQVHEFHVPPLIKDQIKTELYSPQWRNAVREIYTHIDTGLKMSDDTALKLLTFMKEQREIIQCLVDRAEQLGKNIQRNCLNLYYATCF